MQLIATAQEYTEEEFYAMFYDQFEYQLFKSHLLQTVKKMREGVPEDDENCYRGLEYKFDVVGRRRKLNRTRAYMAVFEEQDRCMDEGSSGAEEIAQVYGALTAHCQSEAFRRGIRDSEIAMSSLIDVVKAYGYSQVESMGITLGNFNEKSGISSHPKSMKQQAAVSLTQTRGGRPRNSIMRNIVSTAHHVSKLR